MILRFLSVSAIAFLLTSPLVKRNDESVEKPVIVFGIDNSSSLLMIKDSSWYKNIFPGRINELVSRFHPKFTTELYSFGDRISKGFDGKFNQKQTDISSFFKEIEDRFYNRNVGAVILATDGIYNSGLNPYYSNGNVTFPIYTIALGDTDLKKDIFIRQVRYNRNVYKGDKFPVEITVSMDKCDGVSSSLTVSKGSQTLVVKEIKAATDHETRKITVLLESKDIGIQQYVIRVQPVAGEASELNNRYDCFVDVHESKEKIAIFYASPHPDINTFRQALESSDRYEIETVNIMDLSGFDPEKFDLLVFNQLPSINTDINIDPLLKSGKPLLFILGTQTDLNAFNRMNAGLIINSAKQSFIESQPVLNENFTFFTIMKSNQDIIRSYPPLIAPNGIYQYSPMTDILLYQKIGSAPAKVPLIMLVQNPANRVGFIAGENIWRWRLYSYFQRSDFEEFDEIINKIVQFLVVKDDKSPFKIIVSPTISENESVQIEAEVYNVSRELINEPEVSITIFDPDKKAFPFVFSKSEKAYYLNAGFFQPGKHTYTATVKVGNLTHKKDGSFIVIPVNVESLNLIADQNLLYRMASSHDGKMVQPDKMDSLVSMITAREEIHSVIYTISHLTDLIGIPWVFLFILFLLTLEWTVRKRNGL